jgi:cytoskeletal protein CcmA (bactofilin family)
MPLMASPVVGVRSFIANWLAGASRVSAGASGDELLVFRRARHNRPVAYRILASSYGLGASGSQSISGNLAVTGTSTLTGNVTAGGTLAVTGTSAHTGNATFGGTLAVTGASTLTGNVSAGGTLAVTGTTTLTGAVTTGSTITSQSSLVVTKASRRADAAFTTLTDAATIAVDMASAWNFKVTLGGNRTLGTPTNLHEGQEGWIQVIQDGTGSRTLAYDTGWSFGDPGAPTLSTTAAKIDLIRYVVVSTTGPVIRAVFHKAA